MPPSKPENTQSATTQSRLTVSLNTNETESFDQVIAITQRIINHDIKSLFDRFPAMERIANDNPEVGTINARLEPATIVIAADEFARTDARKVYYMLKSGFPEPFYHIGPRLTPVGSRVDL